MKKILLVWPVLLLLVNQADAQISKGNVVVGADIANFRLGLEKDAGYSITLNPKAAWFIHDNLALGAYVMFGIGQSNKSGPVTTTYGVGPWARYYAGKSDLNLLKHGRWFAEVNAGIEGRNVSDGGGSTNGLGIGFGPGYAYFITPNIAFETLLKWNPIIGFGDKNFQSNLTLNFGFQIYLPGKATINRVKKEEGIQ